MKQKAVIFIKIFIFSFFLLGQLSLVDSAQAFNIQQSCEGNVCPTTIDDLPENSTSVAPNTSVVLNFNLVNKADGSNFSNPCPSGKSLFHVVRHYSGTSYDYLKYGAGPEDNLTYNSGNAGQQNKYEGVFYCDLGPTAANTGASFWDTKLPNVSPKWQTPTYSRPTAAAASPRVVVTPQKAAYAPNEVITVTVENLPAGQRFQLYQKVNNTQVPINMLSFPIRVSTQEGFDIAEGASNRVQILARNESGQFITLANSSFTVKVSSQTASTAPANPGAGGTGGAAAPRGDCTKTPNAQDCLYNPLPTGDLTTMFLLIARGTLGLVAIWAVIFIIVGGFRMVMSQGNEEAYGQAKRTITWAILGVVIAVLSFSIVAIVQDLLKADIKPTIEAETVK